MESLKKIRDDITQRLDGMLFRERALQSYLARNVYRQYQKAQIERWTTQGASETGKWAEISSAWKKRKIRLYGAGPGSKILYATGRLFGSVSGYKDTAGEHRVLVSPKNITIQTATPYAEYVEKKREFMKFSAQTTRDITSGIRDFLILGQSGGIEGFF